MDWKKKALIAGGVSLGIASLPIFKVGRDRGVSMLGVLKRHITSKENPGIREIMVEESYEQAFKKVFEGEKARY